MLRETDDENIFPRLSIQTIKDIKGYSNIDDHKAHDIVSALIQLALITYYNTNDK